MNNQDKGAITKIVDRILEKIARTSHPRTKTLSDLIVQQYKLKKFIVEKGQARISKEDMKNEPKQFIEALKNL